jgi:hypothetical protein
MGVFEINPFLTAVKIAADAINNITGYAERQKVRAADAHEAISSAFIDTDTFLRSEHGGNISNPELAKAWAKAAAKVILVDKPLGEMLHNKSRFWTNPNLFIDFGKEDEIIELNEILEEMEKIRMKI